MLSLPATKLLGDCTGKDKCNNSLSEIYLVGTSPPPRGTGCPLATRKVHRGQGVRAPAEPGTFTTPRIRLLRAIGEFQS